MSSRKIIDSNGVTHNEYKKYLKSEHWKDKRKEFKGDYIRVCVICGTNENIHLHHMTYKNVGNENLNELCYLCEECHNNIHSKEDETPNRKLINTFKRNSSGVVIPKQYQPVKKSKKQIRKEREMKARQEKKERKRRIKEGHNFEEF